MMRVMLLPSRVSIQRIAHAQPASERFLTFLYVALQIDASPSPSNHHEQQKTIPAFGGPSESDDGALLTGRPCSSY